MKKKLAMLFVVIMILSCMPVMAAVPAGASSAANTVSVSATTQGWQKAGSNWRYYVSGSYVKNQIRKINSAYYCFDANGYLKKDWVTFSGKKYFASWVEGEKGYGKVLSGYRKIGDYYYYLDPYNRGAMKTGLVQIGSKYYYFDTSTGRQVRSKGATVIANGRKYEVQADGHLKLIGKATVTPANGVDKYGMDQKAQSYSSSTRYLILVNKKHHSINIYQGSKGKWVCIKRDWRCTIGKSSTPSPSGKYTLNHKSSRPYGYKDFSGSTVFYATRISAGNYFHSILYKKGSRNPYTAKVRDGSLGKSKSNSCIRLATENAKFIHQVTPTNTKVVVY